MTVSLDNTRQNDENEGPVVDNDSMRLVLTAIRYDLSLDPTKAEKQIRKRLSDFATAINHISKSLMTTPGNLTVSAAVEGESALVEYFSRIHLSKQTRAQVMTTRNAVLRYARRFGFSPASFSLLEAWEPILDALRPAYSKAITVVEYAIGSKLHPADFSQAHLDIWANSALDAGKLYATVRQSRCAFLAAVRKAGFQSHLPRLDFAARKLPGYRFPLKDMPESLRTAITRVVESERADKEIAAETQCEITEHFEDFCGYAKSIRELDVVALEPLLKEPLVKEFAFWLHKERKCKRTTIVGRLSRMFTALETCPDFADCDFSWIRGVYRKLRREPESALKERRRQRHTAFQELAAIPGRIRDERKILRNPSLTALGWRTMEELLLTFLILAQYPPRFVRKAVIGVNIFRGPIPEDGPPFTIPAWAEESLRANPDTHFWQFRYESKEGQLFRGLVLQRIVPLLELWLNEYRPLLIGADDHTGSLFFNRDRQPLTANRLGEYVTNLSRRFAKKRITVTSIRSSFAHYYRERHPDKDAVLANIQWVQFATIKLRYDEEYRKQRRARAARRQNQYS